MSNPDAPGFETEHRRVFCSKLAKSYLPELLQDFATAKAYLKHPDVKARAGAVMVLRDYWKATRTFPEFPDICERLAMSDNNADVRCCAMLALMECYDESNNTSIGALLANVVRNEQEPTQNRHVAYCGLFAVRGCTHLFPDKSPVIPQDVDWRFVNSFLQADEKDDPPA